MRHTFAAGLVAIDIAALLALLPTLWAGAPASQPASAPTTGPATAPATTQASITDRMMVSPALADHASLKIRLLPDVADQTEGNAAPLYMEVSGTPLISETQSYDRALSKNFWNLRDKLQEIPTDRWPPIEINEIYPTLCIGMDDYAAAARCDHADWSVSVRGRGMFASHHFEYLTNALRAVVAMKGQVEILRSDWKNAEQTIQTGLATSRHLNDGHELVDKYYATAFATMILGDDVEMWVGRPGSPNLYWALSALPRPFVIPPDATEEWAVLSFTDLQIARALNGKLPPNQWRAVLKELLEYRHYGDSKPFTDVDRATDQLVAETFDRAKASLIKWGASSKSLEKRSKENVVGEFFVEEFQRFYDDITRCYSLSSSEGNQLITSSWNRILTQEPNVSDNPLIQIEFQTESVTKRQRNGLPILVWHRNLFDIDEQIAMYRTIEAVRDYAARHGGNPPDKLDQITELPLPLEPYTNKPFEYEVKGKTFIVRQVKPYLYFHIHEMTLR